MYVRFFYLHSGSKQDWQYRDAGGSNTQASYVLGTHILDRGSGIGDFPDLNADYIDAVNLQ